jgi:5-formyltetrahydrofolate cyclo-ligase
VTTPDVVIVPLLAYDGYGGRLGQGGGYYDRTLAALRRANPETRAIGIAFSAQAVERLELEPHDERLDGVLTEAGYTPAMKDPA